MVLTVHIPFFAKLPCFLKSVGEFMNICYVLSSLSRSRNYAGTRHTIRHLNLDTQEQNGVRIRIPVSCTFSLPAHQLSCSLTNLRGNVDFV